LLDDYDDATSNGLSRNRSEIFKYPGSKKNLNSRTDMDLFRKVETEYTPNRLGVNSIKPMRGEGDAINTLDGMLETSPKVDQGRKLSTFASRQSSPDENLEQRGKSHPSRSLHAQNSVEKKTSLGKGEAMIRKQSTLSQPGKRSQEEVLRKDEPGLHLLMPHYNMEGSLAYNLQIIREERTLDEYNKYEDSRTSPPRILKALDKRRMSGLNYNDKRSNGRSDLSDNENNYNNVSNDGSFSRDKQGNESLKHKRPEPIMIQQKVVELDDIQFTATKKKPEKLPTNNKFTLKVEEKLHDSLVVPPLLFNQSSNSAISYGDERKTFTVGGSPRLKLNDDIFDFRKSVDNKEDEKIFLVSQQVDLISDEIIRMIEELQAKKKTSHKEKNG